MGGAKFLSLTGRRGSFGQKSKSPRRESGEWGWGFGGGAASPLPTSLLTTIPTTRRRRRRRTTTTTTTTFVALGDPFPGLTTTKCIELRVRIYVCCSYADAALNYNRDRDRNREVLTKKNKQRKSRNGNSMQTRGAANIKANNSQQTTDECR